MSGNHVMESSTPGDAEATICCKSSPLPDPLSILLVGEGNLSFAYALVRRLSRSVGFRRATQSAAAGAWGSVAEVVATTYDSEAELAAKYPEAAAFRAYFAVKQRVRVRYVGCVNATALTSSLADADVTLAQQRFHLVVFNNPHIGFEDLYRQRSLLSHFFASAAELVDQGPSLSQLQEVVVALCDDQAQRWDLLGCAARSGYLCVAAQPLLSSDYPEYTNRRHQSDAAFPFQCMVQYWFVRPTAALRLTLQELRTEVAAWEYVRLGRAEKGQPCGFSCAAWLQVADALLATLPAPTQEIAATTGSPLEVPAEDCCNLCVSLNYTACDSVALMPLLHPRLVAHVLSPLLCPADSSTLPPGAECFTPYLPSTTWASLYRAQRTAEEGGGVLVAPTSTTAADMAEMAVPPHLDAAQLGRPLTSKEAKKLERYLAGYGAAMRAKAVRQRKHNAAASADNAVSWECTDCAPPRRFDTEADLRQHHSSKHSGAVQLVPTLYARVHNQIERPSAAASDDNVLSAALEGMSLHDTTDNRYCAICGLQYKTPEAYDEHLRYLAPLPGDMDAPLTCDLCDPPKHFTDRRGLEQHRSSKHRGTAMEAQHA
jgi:hypothetical protein